MGQLLIRGRNYNLQDVKDYPSDYSNLSPFHQRTFSFIIDWNLNKSTFQIETSGSTGKPKSLTVNRKQMEASVSMTALAFGLSKGHTALHCLDPCYIAGKMMIARALILNFNLVVIEPSATPLKDVDSTKKIDFAAFVPFQIQRMINEGMSESINAIHTIILGGAPITSSLEAALQELDVEIYQTYGMTETLSHIAIRRCNGPDRSQQYKVLGGIQIDQDSRNCLNIKGAVTNDELIQTNDIVEILDHKTFRWLGRFDNIINSGGIKINPELLEQKIGALLNAYGVVNRFILCGKSDKALGQKLVIILEGIPEMDSNTLLSKLQTQLDRHHSPKDLIYLDSFVETSSGKIARDVVMEQALKQ